jgi:2-iminoacetate synthase
MTQTVDIIDASGIENALASANTGKAAAREALAAARTLKGLTPGQAASLIGCCDPEVEAELFETARFIKDTIYGSRLVLFAPLYISNYCSNECTYCAFRKNNKEARRRALNQEEVAREVKALVEQGHKRILMVAGEAYSGGFEYILDSIRTIYETRSGNGEIRRVNVNLAPCTIEEFKLLIEAQIGTYQIFQETYHEPTYRSVHLSGPKRNYEYRLATPHRAMEAGINDIGIGALLGLYDWRFEALAMLEHAASLERVYGCGPHTISFPRLQPASGVQVDPKYLVNDDDFKKLIAVLRLAVPYTGLICTARENSKVRREVMEFGVSQIDAGSRVEIGGYTELGDKYNRFGIIEWEQHINDGI